MKDIAIVTLITESGEDIIIDAYNDFDEANNRVVDLIVATGNMNYHVQYVQLH